MDKFNKREKILIGLIIIIIIFFSLILKNFLVENEINDIVEIENYENEEKNNETKETEENQSLESKEPEIMVYITGNIKNPGLIELESGSRLKDVVDLAGGYLEETDINQINLARRVVDEEKIYIPRLGEEVQLETTNENSGNNGKININTCSKEELESLPGIGSKKADLILEYRKADKFNSIEDIMKVSGIGEKTFHGFKDSICVK